MSDDKQNTEDIKEGSSDKLFIRYDDYWLQKGRTMIDGSLEALSNRLKTLDNFLNYLIGGSFIGSVGLTTYLQSTEIGVYGLVAIALFFIAFAKYKVNVKGTEPALENADMRSPTQINENYAQILETLSQQVKDASFWVAVATGFALILLPLAVYFHNCNKQSDVPKTYLSIQNDGNNLSLQGVIPKAEKVSLILYGKDAKKQLKAPIYTDLLLLKPEQLNATIDLKSQKLQLDSLDINYIANGQKQRHTFRMVTNTITVKKKGAKSVEVDSTKIKNQ